MLAKQAWRILHDGGSLLGRTLKAKYFPRVPFLTATIAHNPSFTWRSIMAAMEVIKQGSIWRVGNGRDIRVWHDKWIPDIPGGRPQIEEGNDTLNLRVADLMMEDGIRWNFETITDMFPADICSKILSIPIARHRGNDLVIWKHTSNGIYSVKSGYQVACSLRNLHQSAASSSNTNLPTWRWINKLQIPAKITFFMWRCAKGILPVAVELNKKQVPIEPICRRCGEDNETMEHALRDCPWSEFFWQVSPLRIQINPAIRATTMRQWFDRMAEIQNDEAQRIFAILLWSNWKARNNLVFENKSIPHEVAIGEAMKLVGELRPIPSRGIAQQLNMKEEKWVKPPADFWKVNVDASIGKRQDIGIGIIIRDMCGKLITCRYQRIRGQFTAEAAEGISYQEGILLARYLGGTKIVMETDCLALHQKIIRPRDDLTSIGDVIKSILHESSLCESIIYSWARRTGNMASHLLASLALSFDSFSCDTGSFPNRVLLDVPELERRDF